MQLAPISAPLDEVTLAHLYGPHATRRELCQEDHDPLPGDEGSMNTRSAGVVFGLSLEDVDSRRTCAHRGPDLELAPGKRFGDRGAYVCAVPGCGKPIADRKG